MAKQKLNSTQITDDTWHEIGAAGEPAYLNSWVRFTDTAYNSPAFRKDALGFVHLKGMAQSGVIGFNTPIFILPVGYRPIKQNIIPAITNPNAAGRLDVSPDGKVCAITGSNAWFSLDGATFKAEL